MEKKKILVLTSWKADREQKIVVRRLLKEIDPKRFDVAVLSAWANEPGLLKDFETKIPEHMAKLMSHGRMTVSEQECRNYRILEKYPDICVKYGEVRRYVNGLMDREWGRTLGNNSWDVCLLLGSMGYLQYYMAARAQAKKKILVDLDFLPYIREKNPAAWRGEYWQLFEHCPSCGRKRLGYRRLNGRRKVCRFRRDCIPGKGWA